MAKKRDKDLEDKQVLVGNFADLQRGLGVEMTLPEGVEEEDVISPAEADAEAGLTTVETEREGLKPKEK